MPIDIDNTDVSNITIDGQNVSEVTADGNVVWNAIPDSGVLRYDFEDDSDTSITVDTFENGNSGSNSGGSYVPTPKFGSLAMEFVGEVYLTHPALNTISLTTDWSMSAFINLNELPSGNNFNIWHPRNHFDLALGVSDGDRFSQGEIYLNSYNGGGNTLASGVTAPTGNYLQVGVGYDGNGGYEIITNGSSAAADTLPDPASTPDQNYIGTRPDNSPGGSNFTANHIIDRFDIYSRKLSDTEWSNLSSEGDI